MPEEPIVEPIVDVDDDGGDVPKTWEEIFKHKRFKKLLASDKEKATVIGQKDERITKLETDLSAVLEAQKTATDKLRQELERVQLALKTREDEVTAEKSARITDRKRKALEDAAREKMMEHVEDIHLYIKDSDVQLDEAGNPTNYAQLVADVLEKRPNLVKRRPSGIGNPSIYAQGRKDEQAVEQAKRVFEARAIRM